MSSYANNNHHTDPARTPSQNPNPQILSSIEAGSSPAQIQAHDTNRITDTWRASAKRPGSARGGVNNSDAITHQCAQVDMAAAAAAAGSESAATDAAAMALPDVVASRLPLGLRLPIDRIGDGGRSRSPLPQPRQRREEVGWAGEGPAGGSPREETRWGEVERLIDPSLDRERAREFMGERDGWLD